MPLKHPLLVAASIFALCPAAPADEGTVTWHDPSCGFFVLTLPGDQEEKFGLFSWKSGADPRVEQVWEGDLVKGEEIGVAKEVLTGPGGDLLSVTIKGKDLLIPFRKPIVKRIDRAARRIELDPPEGLLDL